MHMSVQEIMDQIYDSYPPSRIQLMKLMRRHTIRQIVWEYMAKAYDERLDSTRVDDVTNKLWDKLHP